jgi:hypothetical protein
MAMNHNIKSRLFSAALLVAIVCFFFHYSYFKQQHLGKEAFLENQSKEYDYSDYAHQYSFSTDFYAIIVVIGGLFAVYEVLAFGFCRVLKKRISPDESRMNHKLKNRFFSAALLIAIVSFFYHDSPSRRTHLGKEAFLERQSKEYDSYYAHPYSFSKGLYKGLFVTTVVIGGLFAVYELLTVGFSKMSKTMSSDESKKQPQPADDSNA